MKKQVWSGLLALSMTASMLSPAALAAEITVPDDNQNAIAVVSDTNGSSGNSTETNSFVKEANPASDFDYTVVEDYTRYTYSIKITGYKGDATEVVIPDTIDGYPVDMIAGGAFQNKEITSVTLPDSVSEISENMFSGCSALTEVTIPYSVSRINANAFKGCTALKTMTYGGRKEDLSIETTGNEPLSAILEQATYKGFEYDNFIYEDLGDQARVIRYTGEATDIAIPDTVNGKSVTSIGSLAFGRSKSLSSVKIPEGVTRIGFEAFMYCHITSIVLPDSLETIDCEAFFGSFLNSSIEIPGGVSSIGRAAFAHSDLVSVTIKQGVKTISDYAFYECFSLKEVTIPKSIKAIGECAFYKAEYYGEDSREASLSGVNYGGTKKKWLTLKNNIGKCNDLLLQAKITYAEEESDLYSSQPDGSGIRITLYKGSDDEIEIPAELDGKKIISIGDGAFRDNTTVTSVTIPEGVTSIGNAAFAGCSNLAKITLPDSLNSIVAGAFNGCTSLKEITLPNNVTSIGMGTFQNCTGLTEITIPDKITSIGRNTFSGCTSLTKVTLPRGLTSIGSNAFFENTALETIVYGGTESEWNKVTHGENNQPLEDAEKVFKLTESDGYIYGITDADEANIIAYTGTDTTVTIPNEMGGKPVTSIGDSAFEQKTVTSVVIPDSVTSIGNSAFFKCRSLTSVTIPKSLTSIGQSAFYMCDALTSPITLPDSVTSIGMGAFQNCKSIPSVKLPNGLEKIDNYTFCACQALTSITIPDSVTSIGEHAFRSCIGLTSLRIPSKVTTIGQYAFYVCSRIAWVELPVSIQTISPWAFANCSSIKAVYYAGTQEQYEKINFTVQNQLLQKNTVLFQTYRSGNYVYQLNDAKEASVISYTGTDTAVEIPETLDGNPVTSIGENAFAKTAVTSVVIPEGVTSIGKNAFAENNNNLIWISLPKSVASIGEGAFGDCGSLERIYYGGAKTDWENLTSKTGENNDPLTNASIYYTSDGYMYQVNDKDEVSLARYMGTDEKVKIPATLDGCKVTSIGISTFEESTMTSVVIPDGVTSIDAFAFYSCTALTSVTLPKSVTSIASNAFFGCDSLKKVYYSGTKADWEKLQDNVGVYNDALTDAARYYTSGDYTYQVNDAGEVSITKYNGEGTIVVIPSELDGCKVTSIDAEAFKDCTTLRAVEYGGTKTDWDNLKQNIGENNDPLLKVSNIYYTSGDYIYQVNDKNEVTIAKYNGKDEKVEIPSELDGCKVTTIAREAFRYCENMEEITIPGTVTTIGPNAFFGCTGLKKAYYDGYREDISFKVGNRPLTKVLTYKPKIICKGSEQVKISSGTHEMRIHGQSYGEYTFTWVEDQAGWTVQNAEKQYLSFADGELVLSDEPFIWHYDAKLYTTTEEKVQHRYWWWSYTTTETVYWYLTGDGENLTLSKSDKEADLALYDAVEATEHRFGDWVSDGNGTGTHSHTCTVCGEKETADCTYDDNGYCTVCGAINPEKASVSVTAEVTKHTTRSGWWWWCRPTTTWTANISATGEGVDVATVEYSLDGENYETGTTFTSKEEITTFYIRVTDSKDNVTNWIYEDGEVTQVTDSDSEQNPDQDSEQDSTEQDSTEQG